MNSEYIFINNGSDVFLRIEAISEEHARNRLDAIVHNSPFEFSDNRWNLLGDIPLDLDGEFAHE